MGVGPVVVREDKLWRCTHGANVKLLVHQRPAEEQRVTAADGVMRPKLEHCGSHPSVQEPMWSCTPTSMLAAPASHTSTQSRRARADRSEVGHHSYDFTERPWQPRPPAGRLSAFTACSRALTLKSTAARPQRLNTAPATMYCTDILRRSTKTRLLSSHFLDP